ncbi:hypothetical protein [Agrobacterium tumefaciens]|uniref:hypothetical protein n=1 Tax=Agrobacterium tumefaciens TaxID=358 RepID=UPI002B1BD7E8|nr:hypothetical protein [Agrobacterium tumefaciens]
MKDHEAGLDNNILPYFGKMSLSAVTAAKVRRGFGRCSGGSKRRPPLPQSVNP